jgi:hypothetical protein
MTPAEKQRRYRERKFGDKPPVSSGNTIVAEQAARMQELEAENARLRARIDKLERSEEVAKHNRTLLRRLGINPRGLSAAEISKGVRLASRLLREDCGLPPAARTNKDKAAAEWRAFWAKRRAAGR